MGLNRDDEAIRSFNKAIELGDEDGDITKRVADEYHQFAMKRQEKKEYEGARNLLRKAIKLEPENKESHQKLANSYYEQGLNYFNKHPRIYIKEDYEKAEEMFKKAIEINKNIVEAHCYLAKTFLRLSHDSNRLKRIDSALAEAEIAMKLNPNSDLANMALASAYSYKGSFGEDKGLKIQFCEKANEYYFKVLEINPNSKGAKVGLNMNNRAINRLKEK